MVALVTENEYLEMRAVQLPLGVDTALRDQYQSIMFDRVISCAPGSGAKSLYVDDTMSSCQCPA